jgi:RimJ/RimL family protein N-acetyltransferase
MYGGNLSDLRPMTEDVAKRWVRRLLDQDYAWIIEAGRLIGEIRLDRIDLRDKRASLAIGIEDASQLGKGLGTEAIVLALGYAFGVLRLHRISVRVVDYNVRAIRAYQKCGFIVEGREREALQHEIEFGLCWGAVSARGSPALVDLQTRDRHDRHGAPPSSQGISRSNVEHSRSAGGAPSGRANPTRLCQ